MATASVALIASASAWAIGAASPVGADDVGIQGCWKPGHWVVFEDINYNWWGGSPATMNCWGPGVRLNMPSNINNKVSSLENNTNVAACFWEHSNQKGYFFLLGANSRIADLRAYSFPTGGTWNDRISSVSPYPCCSGMAVSDAGTVATEPMGPVC